MFALTLLVGPQGTPWTLMYKTREKIDEHQAFVNAPNPASIKLEDDFGQIVSVNTINVHAIMLEDLQQSQLAHIERALHHGRTNAKTMEAAQADPVLKAAALRQQMSPAIIDPTRGAGNGMMPFRPM